MQAKEEGGDDVAGPGGQFFLEMTLMDDCIFLRTQGNSSFTEVQTEKHDPDDRIKVSTLRCWTTQTSSGCSASYCWGDVVSHIEKVGCLQEEQAHRIFTQMVRAVPLTAARRTVLHVGTSNQTTSCWMAKEVSDCVTLA